jgi:heme A synthase
MGCGDHWPTCRGHLLPPLDRPDLVIEVTHRYLAAALTAATVALLVVAIVRRRGSGVGGRGGVLRAATLATLLVVAAAVLGAVTVKLALNPAVIVIHKAVAITLLAALASVVIRAGGLGARAATSGAIAPRTFRAARAAAALAFVVVIFGGLTANLPGANVACAGFPLCRNALPPGFDAHVQLAHRVLAYLLFLHLLGLAVAATRRREAWLGRRLAWAAFGVVLAQLLVAAALVTLALPAPLRSLHQGVGILVWLVTFTFAALGRRAVAARRQAG